MSLAALALGFWGNPAAPATALAQRATSADAGLTREAGGPELYPAGTFASPVRHPIKVSGTFGELRSDHFHMGLDVKSARGVAGDDVYAVADGYVSRLLVSSAGFGNAVYVDHPATGTRSVYAHLRAFAPALRRYLDSVHYAEQRFELDLGGLPAKRFPIARGQRLGAMGNTGSSFGAHLHFELRLAADDAAFNPLLYDLPVRDARAPELRGLGVYARRPNGATELLRRVTPTRDGGSDRYRVAEPIRVPPGAIGLALKAYDRQEGTRNLNGVFAIESRADGRTHWRARYDTVAFEDTRYIQAHYDYAAKHDGDGYYYRLHRLPADRLALYDAAPDDGFLALGFGESRTVDVTVSDPFGNAATLALTLVADDTAAAAALAPAPAYNYLLRAGQATTLRIADAELDVPARAVYHDTYLAVHTADDPADGAYSRCYTLGDPAEPLHDAPTLRVPLGRVPMHLRPNAYLTPCGGDTDSRLPAKLTTGSTHLAARLDAWGAYEVRVDTTAPTIRVLDRRTYRIADDVTAARDLRYRVSQNGTWVLAALDAKTNRLTIRPEHLAPGTVTVEVWDEAGNKATR